MEHACFPIPGYVWGGRADWVGAAYLALAAGSCLLRTSATARLPSPNRRCSHDASAVCAVGPLARNSNTFYRAP